MLGLHIGQKITFNYNYDNKTFYPLTNNLLFYYTKDLMHFLFWFNILVYKRINIC